VHPHTSNFDIFSYIAMLLKQAVLFGLVSASAQELDDDVTLLQLNNKVSIDAPIYKAIHDVAKARSPVEASLIVKDLTEKAIRGEVSIDDATKEALNTMLATLTESQTLITESHTEDEALRNNAAMLVGNCKVSYDGARAEDSLVGGEVTSSDDSHDVCRSALKEMDADKTTKCNALTSFIDGLTTPNCNKPDRTGMQGYFDGLKNHVESNYDTWKEKNDACVDAENAVVLKDTECDTIQGQFETKFCSYRLEMFTTCSEYVGCYANSQAEFEAVMATTGVAQESRKIEWNAIKKINCYVAVLVDDENPDRKAELDKCQVLDPDVSALTLAEPTVDGQDTCNLSPVAQYPCTADFLTNQYSGMIGLLDCQACPALPSHIDIDNGHICAPLEDTFDGWSNTKHAEKDGIVHMGGFDHGQKTVTKIFDLVPGVQYKMSVVLDTWASVDNEAIRIKANDKQLDIQSRGAGDCNNGWTHYPYGTGTFVGSSGSGKHNWQDCWKKAELSFAAPANGKVHVEMYMGIDQHIGDEAWGWHSLKFEPVNCPAVSRAKITDECSGWSADKSAVKDGICYMGAFDNSQKTITKTFEGLTAGCTYTWRAVIDTWASVDNEQMTFTLNGQAHNFQSRGAGDCNNGWTPYPNDFGDFVGSHGSANGGWKDCWKNFEAEFVAPSNGNAAVSMYMAIDQGISDEGFGWHSMEFERTSCPSASDRNDDCSGWSVDKHADVDGTCFMGAFDNSGNRVTKSFSGLSPMCTYKWSAVIDTWASVDNEAITLSVNGQAHNVQSRGAGSCNNGWTEYPHDFGDKVGSHGSANGGWKDCWRNFDATFVAPASGKADVDMYMAINQGISDEGWGWHNMKFQRLSCPGGGGESTDDCSGWSVDVKHDVDGKCFMGAFDNTNRVNSKTFSGLSAGCTYKWKAVIDTWASVDNEKITLTVNNDATDFQSRAHNSCGNGWTEYPDDFGDKVGSHGSQHGGFKDCWKNFEKEFVVPADGKAHVEMKMLLDQNINDEGWGWHDMEFEKMSCR